MGVWNPVHATAKSIPRKLKSIQTREKDQHIKDNGIYIYVYTIFKHSTFYFFSCILSSTNVLVMLYNDKGLKIKT